ncbi:MAG: hypothetical protein B6U89_02110 [Desulfurococcales archaeon ex4484_58]|nr:MAG: hypothetical protein B6U89_02110 [Desulfurococcales archaeon ex4484_58]
MGNIIVKHNMIGSHLLGMGGSEYVALETVIGLSKKNYRVCLKTNPFVKKEELFRRAVELYGIPYDELYRVKMNSCSDEYISINCTGDFLSGYGHIIYFHYPSILPPKTYYPVIEGSIKLFADTYYLLNKIFMPKILAKSLVILANSTQTAEKLSNVIKRRINILFPPVNINEERSPLSRDDRDKIVLVVSRISYEKQPYRVLYLAHILKKLKLQDWRIVFVGSKSIHSDKIINEILSIAKKRGLKDFIEFKVMIKRKDLIKLYRRSYMYVHLTSHEHFGLSIVEAMSHGTPAIIPKDSGAWFDVALQRKDLALPYTSLADLENNIKSLIENHILWETLSLNSYKRAKFFDRRRFHEKIIKYVEYVESIIK